MSAIPHPTPGNPEGAHDDSPDHAARAGARPVRSRLGNIGLDWQYAGVAPIQAPGVSDLVLRNVNTGAFQVYNIANNQITGTANLGAVGLNWQLGGFAADPPTAATGSSDGSTSQLVQAMAGFGGGAADGLNTAPLSADTSQQTFLTTPHA